MEKEGCIAEHTAEALEHDQHNSKHSVLMSCLTYLLGTTPSTARVPGITLAFALATSVVIGGTNQERCLVVTIDGRIQGLVK